MKQILMVIALILALISIFIVPAQALERKALSRVDINGLAREGQAINTETGLHIVWWIPVEFWAANLKQKQGLPEKTIESIVSVLKPYSLFAVSQADVSDVGDLSFYDKKQIAENLKIAHITPDGRTTDLPLLRHIPKDLKMMHQQLKPILAGALGKVGMNFYFFTVFNRVGEDQSILSPYAEGILKVDLKKKDGEPIAPLVIETPLDALFLPRTCPNGKKAHVSWKYCPWSGAKLE